MRGGGPRLAKSPDRHEGREVIPRYVRFTSAFPMTVAELTRARVTDVEPT